jgi:hypothetical protein
MFMPISLIIMGGIFFLKWREDVARGIENSRWMRLSAFLAGIGLIGLLCALTGYL